MMQWQQESGPQPAAYSIHTTVKNCGSPQQDSGRHCRCPAALCHVGHSPAVLFQYFSTVRMPALPACQHRCCSGGRSTNEARAHGITGRTGRMTGAATQAGAGRGALGRTWSPSSSRSPASNGRHAQQVWLLHAAMKGQSRARLSRRLLCQMSGADSAAQIDTKV